ncbi:bifunctional diguanylate cyclase/phosphodiesterase [Croceicoccus sp. YJ47]|uniref:putative bifunctional diguanylate cyclase/phosphodiesterase n=1 Tax=Croceicoccus sp. YJ47 TaxID=2798724 RepID=UPI001922354F|nr:EAL domain-containing protein [Croceicoccus sp. YJ47]QQN73978.1 EAL domain-containing protein [Croceicoccus sp. YJ47]
MSAFERIDFFRFGSLKLRMTALYAALFAAVLAVVLAIVGQAIDRFAENAATHDLAANARVFEEILALRARQMRSSSEVLSRDFGFREAVATADRPTLASALDSLRERSGSRSAFVVGYDASLVGSTGDAMPDPAELWNALDNGQGYGVITQGGQLALAAASPIEVPDLVGWLVVTQPLDQAELSRLVDLGAIDLGASVMRRARLPQAIANAPPGEVFERGEGERMLYRVSNLRTLEDDLHPVLVLQYSLTRSLAQYSSIRWLLAALAGAGLALVVALSWRVAKTITAPLRKLDEATRIISAGERVALSVETDDEIGRLAASFNTMIEAIEEREKRIVHVGLHDGLTNLPNRKLFAEQLALALSRRRENRQVMVICADLDDFKAVNETLGHPAGDTMLVELAHTLRQSLPNGTTARLGGDEFAIMIDDIAPGENLDALARRVQTCFAKDIEIAGRKTVATASLGIAVAPGDGADGVTLMKHADLALHRAKSGGRACHHFFEPALDEQARHRRQMELDLRDAIANGGFELHFQPLYSLREDRLKGFEALIRWNHPTRGMVAPGDFIGLAEETGLIIAIGEWVVHEACRQASQWPGDLSVAVNISPRQFAAPELIERIKASIAATGIAPRRLELEITESIFIADVETTLAALHDLRRLGVRIALDDFGTGYSSLGYLRSFPFDKVKIDRSFVNDLTDGGNGHAIIRAITTLAAALGMETLAEGVENRNQLAILRREGCESIQGFLLSRPMPVCDMKDWLNRRNARNFVTDMLDCDEPAMIHATQ